MEVVLFAGVVLLALLCKPSVLEFLGDMFPLIYKATSVANKAVAIGGAVVEKLGILVTPVLAWLWVLSIGLTLAEWFTPLEMASRYLRSGAHSSIWVLSFFAARHFGWPQKWPIRLWKGSVLLAGGALLLVFFYIGLPLLYAGAAFFLPISEWRTTYVYFQRGETIVADQMHKFALGGGGRRVLLRPVTPLLQWVEPLTYQANNIPGPPAGPGWVVVNKTGADFSPDPLKQLELNNAKEMERRCWADRRRIDSLAICGQLPLAARTLPVATRHGANTVGCLVGGEVWRNYLIWPKPEECRQAGAVGRVRKLSPGQPSVEFSLSAIMRIGNIYRYINLRLPEMHGPGVYALSNDAYETNSPESAHLMLTSQKTVEYSTTKEDYITTARFPATVTITHFDTVAREVSGTFEGRVYDVSNKVGPLPVTQGRFDVRYYD